MKPSNLILFFVPLVVSFLLLALDARIAALSDLIEKEALSDRDRNLALALLSSYPALHEALERPLTESEKEAKVRLLYEKLSYIDENYFTTSLSLQRFSQEKERILQYYLSGDHGSVIEACLGLEERFGPEALSPEVGLLFALSLGRKGMYPDALKVGENIKRKLEGNPDLVYLQAQMIEWHLALGQKAEASQVYEGLQDQIDERAGMTRPNFYSFAREYETKKALKQ
ncbi:MAG: hypothetical protein P8175_01250 [Deltaproteobacteria bacterium]